MVISDGDFGAEWADQVGSTVKGAATQGAQTAAVSLLQSAMDKVTGGNKPAAAPPPKEGIPPQILMIGAGVLGLVLLAKLFSRKPRALVANPGRRRRRRRHTNPRRRRRSRR